MQIRVARGLILPARGESTPDDSGANGCRVRAILASEARASSPRPSPSPGVERTPMVSSRQLNVRPELTAGTGFPGEVPLATKDEGGG
jgi:hypothetical protein